MDRGEEERERQLEEGEGVVLQEGECQLEEREESSEEGEDLLDDSSESGTDDTDTWSPGPHRMVTSPGTTCRGRQRGRGRGDVKGRGGSRGRGRGKSRGRARSVRGVARERGGSRGSTAQTRKGKRKGKGKKPTLQNLKLDPTDKERGICTHNNHAKCTLHKT